MFHFDCHLCLEFLQVVGRKSFPFVAYSPNLYLYHNTLFQRLRSQPGAVPDVLNVLTKLYDLNSFNIVRLLQQEDLSEFSRYQLIHINVFLRINLAFYVSIVFVFVLNVYLTIPSKRRIYLNQI